MMKQELTTGLAVAGAMLALALIATIARQQGYVDSDTVTRVLVGANGLMIAWFGNRMPKTIAPTHCVARASRVGGWSMVISGLVYAAIWAVAPIDVAVVAGSAVIIVGVAVTFAYCRSLRNRAKAA